MNYAIDNIRDLDKICEKLELNKEYLIKCNISYKNKVWSTITSEIMSANFINTIKRIIKATVNYLKDITPKENLFNVDDIQMIGIEISEVSNG